MRIVINGRFLNQRLTGVQRVAWELTRAIDRLVDEGRYPQLEVTLAMPMGADPAPLKLKHIGADHVAGLQGHFWEQIALARYARGAMLLCLGNSAPLPSLIAGEHVGVMLHDQAFRLFPQDYPLSYRFFHRLMGTVMMYRAKPLFTVSHTGRAELAARYPHARAPIIVTPNGSWIDDAPVEHRAVPATGTGAFALYVGSFTTRKNIEAIFTSALALARKRGTRFVFVGPPNELSRAFERRIDDDLKSLIEFRGYVTNDALQQLYREAICLVYPSFYEASGLPPSEAMMFGCPVVVSDLPVLRERCGDAALYCDPHRPETLSAAIERLIDDRDLRASLIAKGYDRAALFTWRGQASRILDALIGKTPPS